MGIKKYSAKWFLHQVIWTVISFLCYLLLQFLITRFVLSYEIGPTASGPDFFWILPRQFHVVVSASFLFVLCMYEAIENVFKDLIFGILLLLPFAFSIGHLSNDMRIFWVIIFPYSLIHIAIYINKRFYKLL